MPDRRRIALALLLAALIPAAAEACRCVTQTAAGYIRGANSIVLARVIGRDDRDPRFRVYRLRVERGWKRPVPGEVMIRSMRTDCMARLDPGQRYLVHLFGAPTALETEQCAGNLPAAAAGAEIALLDRPTPSHPKR